MQSVIMAAGAGTRLRPYTETIPKPLLSLGNETIIQRTLKNLPHIIDEVFLIIGYRGQQIINVADQQYKNIKINYIWQKELKGTWHAAYLAKPNLNKKFLVINGDDIYQKKDLEKLVDLKDWGIMVQEDDINKGDSLIIDARGFLRGLSPNNNGQTRNINTGAYLLGQDFFNYSPCPIKNGKEYGLPQTLANICQYHPTRAIFTKGWHKINSPEDLETVRKLINNNLL